MNWGWRSPVQTVSKSSGVCFALDTAMFVLAVGAMLAVFDATLGIAWFALLRSLWR